MSSNSPLLIVDRTNSSEVLPSPAQFESLGSIAPNSRSIEITESTSKDKNTNIPKEPGNPWIQFCRFKKNKAILERGEKEASYNFKEVQKEWAEMVEEDRSFFVDLSKMERKIIRC